MSGADQDQARGQSRLKEFKNVNKGKNEWRQRRNTTSSELRQNRRDTQISKRRIPLLDTTESDDATPIIIGQLPEFIKQARYDQDPKAMLEGVTGIRKLMCVKNNPPIKAVVSTGVHIRLVQLLRHENPELQFEAAWALTNIVSGDREDTQCVAESGAISALVQLLRSEAEKVRAQAAWALGNIAGDCVEYRDEVLREGAMGFLLKLLWDAVKALDANRSQPVQNNTQDHEILQTGTWAISNFVRGNKADPNYYQMIEGAVEFLASIINFSDDHPTLADACWALSYLTDSDAKRIQKVVEAGVVGRLVKLMAYKHSAVVLPAQRTIGNILAGSDVQTTVVLNHEPLDTLDALLTDDNEMIRKESAWAMSNIFAGTDAQIRKALEEQNKVPRYQIVPKLLKMMMHDSNAKARKEAAWAITNLMSLGNADVMQTLIYDYDGLEAIMRFLKLDAMNMHQLRARGAVKSADSMEKLASNILSSLYGRVLPAGAKMGFEYNIYAQRIRELNHADVFEELALIPGTVLAKTSRDIIAQFFPSDGDSAEYNINTNEGVNADGQMEFNPNLQSGGIQL